MLGWRSADAWWIRLWLLALRPLLLKPKMRWSFQRTSGAKSKEKSWHFKERGIMWTVSCQSMGGFFVQFSPLSLEDFTRNEKQFAIPWNEWDEHWKETLNRLFFVWFVCKFGYKLQAPGAREPIQQRHWSLDIGWVRWNSWYHHLLVEQIWSQDWKPWMMDFCLSRTSSWSISCGSTTKGRERCGQPTSRIVKKVWAPSVLD